MEADGQPIDVALVDINLGGGMNGMELLAELRRRPACQHTHVVAMTAYALPGDEERFLAAGFDRYIAKPFTPHGLHAVLHPRP